MPVKNLPGCTSPEDSTILGATATIFRICCLRKRFGAGSELT
jgi:hypothetical protein